MDLNLVVLSGRLAAPPELRTFESGLQLVRYLVTVQTQEPRRLDVIPVTWWDPDGPNLTGSPQIGQRLWLTGTVQRRFWSGPQGRRSRLEVVAEQVEPRPNRTESG